MNLSAFKNKEITVLTASPTVLWGILTYVDEDFIELRHPDTTYRIRQSHIIGIEGNI